VGYCTADRWYYIPAAVQAVLWWRYRLPFGAVISVLGLLFGEWVNNTSTLGWTYFCNFVFPQTLY
jgi:methane/ammonia monooxygenase subunit A